MKVTCTGRRVSLKPSFVEKAEAKLSKLDKFFPGEAQAQVTVTVDKLLQTVEITVRDKALTVRAEKTSDRMEDALDDAGISELRPWSVLRLDCPYALFERVKLEADKRGGLVRDADYGAQIALTILLPQPEEAAFRKALQELSAGSLAPETTGAELRGVRIR